MTETASKYQVAVRPDTGILVFPNIEERANALIFHRRLTGDVTDRVYEKLTKITEGYQFYWSDFWRELEDLGIDYTQYVPDSVPPSTAANWYTVGARFLPENRKFDPKIIRFSHYAAARNHKLMIGEALRILKAAEEGKWSHGAVALAVKITLGEPKKIKKPKLIQCPHCDNWIAETDKGCGWCILRTTLKSIRDREENDLGFYSSWVRGVCDEVLAEV